MSRYYEITDGNLHVGWVSEDYMFTKMDERVLKGEANFNFHVGDRDAVDVAPVKHGHWVKGIGMMHCSECGTAWWNEIYIHGFKYCPYCGAKMDVPDTDVGKMDETCI
jgi:hypothetical protein